MQRNPLSRQVTVEGIPLVTSKRETDLLEQLLRRSGRVVPKRLLEDGLYSFDTDVSSNSLEAMVSRLRKRLASVPSGVTIHTLRGVGNMLTEEDDAA
ncbi:winged helix-turn-helix domain-containing protein [Azospirillum sp. TSO5]|uniref:winged helix-turn-helix domain-containing protein n=1 Tax=Azospirillum sp. TSO5 TaxID=716760 RepID=UPI001304AF3B|nr:winged helix-turn-helix domain-containing protein [Azospirillum sp. TSO5]